MKAMATYDLPYAQEHLQELFEEARNGEDVIIVRSDGRSCQLLPLADVKDEAPDAGEWKISDLEPLGSAVPA
jgi:antitoxin (DNA-binding transcriptional repressor) of toxin-antitoxin stability system